VDINVKRYLRDNHYLIDDLMGRQCLYYLDFERVPFLGCSFFIAPIENKGKPRLHIQFPSYFTKFSLKFLIRAARALEKYNRFVALGGNVTVGLFNFNWEVFPDGEIIDFKIEAGKLIYNLDELKILIGDSLAVIDTSNWVIEKTKYNHTYANLEQFFQGFREILRKDIFSGFYEKEISKKNVTTAIKLGIFQKASVVSSLEIDVEYFSIIANAVLEYKDICAGMSLPIHIYYKNFIYEKTNAKLKAFDAKHNLALSKRFKGLVEEGQ
jgi:hypothetical protein